MKRFLPRTWWQWALAVIAGLMVVAAVSPTEDSGDSSRTSGATTPGEATTADSAEEEPATRCRKASVRLLRTIAEGLRPSEDAPEGVKLRGGRLTDGYVVRSREDWPVGRGGTMYFISAMIHDANGEVGIGTWASDSPRPGDGLILASDNYAEEFSVWGDAAEDGSPADISFTLDGGGESRACVEDA